MDGLRKFVQKPEFDAFIMGTILLNTVSPRPRRSPPTPLALWRQFMVMVLLRLVSGGDGPAAPRGGGLQRFRDNRKRLHGESQPQPLAPLISAHHDGCPSVCPSEQFVFLCEAVIKLLAYGARDYFDDDWNRLDFVIVAESVVSFVVALFISSDSGFSTSTLRLLRLLRPLRTLRFVPVCPLRAPPSSELKYGHGMDHSQLVPCVGSRRG
jgi:hypothetical protein